MKIENLEQLQELIKLCRKNAIAAIEVDGIKLDLSETPKRTRKKKFEERDTNIETPDALTADELLFWSSRIEGT